jgi:uncharacterized protein YndB with AHSA1/START domain
MTRNGELLTIDGRPTLRFERRYRHSVERVWRAVTEPAEMARWFPSQVIGDRVVGAELVFDDDEQRAAARAAGEPTRDDGPWFHGTVTAFDPPTVFEFTWGGDRLRIELAPDGDGTRLVFTQVLTHRSEAARTGSGWHACLAALDGLLGQPPSPSDDGWEEVYADYLRRMGPALGTPSGDGSMTWERGIHVEPERVRAAVSDPDEVRAWGAGDEPADALRWDVEPSDQGTVYRLTHAAVGGDAEVAARWHALLIQLDMYLAAGQLVPVAPDDWVGPYGDLLRSDRREAGEGLSR